MHTEHMTRAPIDRPISRESSASPNLVGDRTAHPLCDHRAAAVWIQLAPHLSDSQLAAVVQLSTALADSVFLRSLPLVHGD